MQLLDIRTARTARTLAVFAVVAAFSSTLMGCPDKAAPDPAAGKDAGATTAAAAPHPAAGGSAAAPAKSGGW